MAEVYAPCAEHTDALASFQCEGCGRDLCYDCVEEGRLVLCRLCGERARPLEIATPTVAATEVLDGVLYREREEVPAAQDPKRWFEDPMLAVIHHGVVPTATIAMVTALLFFLVDVRSSFLAGSGALKWVGFCFVTASVLIARYGKMSGARDRQGCYTVALGGATFVVVSVAPWENSFPGPAETVFNGVIVLAIWKFATALTRGLSLEDEAADRRGRRLYGLERVAFEQQAQRSPEAGARFRDLARGGGRDSPDGKAEPKGDSKKGAERPGSSVARLAALGLVVFALGEAALLSATTALVHSARTAMVVFLLSAGVVLAASSGVETLRTVRRRGGRVAATTLPGQVIAGGLAMVALLAVALATPGLVTEGRGERLGSGATPGSWDVASDRGSARSDSDSTSPDLADSQPGNDPAPPEAQSQRSTSASQSSAGSSGLLDLLASLGRWLRWPLIAAVVLIGIFGAVKLWPLVRLWGRGFGEGWAAWWANLRGRWGRKGRAGGAREEQRDPWAGLAALAGAPPREAVVEAYTRFLEALEALGFERDPQHTPFEVQTKVSRWRRSLEPAVRRLTQLYVDAAYGHQTPTDADRDQALRALDAIRRDLPAPS